jgi:carboxypeptidase C (cathepsin A)
MIRNFYIEDKRPLELAGSVIDPLLQLLHSNNYACYEAPEPPQISLEEIEVILERK